MKASSPIAQAAVLGLLLACCGVAVPASAQNTAPAAPVRKPDASRGADLGWYREAGLGMFIHWGISSVEAKHELSWAMFAGISWNPNPIKPETYFRLADRFDPANYDPEKWLRAAKDAGFGYAVLTTRHHDGYALWPSQYGDFSTRTRLGGRDLVRPYVEACRKVGLKVGFYYSPPDWHFNRRYMSFNYASKGTPESPHLGLKHERIELPAKPAGFDDQYVDYVNGQVRELLTRYGKIDLLWFDGSAGPKVLSQEQIRTLQPGIVINDRQHGTGDYQTEFEGRMPDKRPAGPWEHCFSMVGAWGYLDSEPCAPASHLLARLVKCRAWGGNILANFAPRSTGDMPEKVYRCLADIHAWMAAHRQAVIGVLPGPYPERTNVPVTVRGNTWYLCLVPSTPDAPAFKGDVLLRGVGKPKKITMLGTGHALESRQNGDDLAILVPRQVRTDSVDVIAVDW